MTIPNSPVIPACAWLVGQLQTAITAADAQHSLFVGYGPVIGEQPDDQVVLSEATSKFDPFAMVGSMSAGAVQETLQIHLTISVARENVDAPEVIFDRVAALVNAAVTVVRTDPTFGGNVLRSITGNVTYPTAQPMDEPGWFLAQTDVVFTCFAID